MTTGQDHDPYGDTAQPEFLLRTGDKHCDGTDLIYQVATLNACYPEINRPAKHQVSSLFRMVEGTGTFDKRQVRIADTATPGGYGNHAAVLVQLTSNGILPVLRRIQPRDVQAVASIDAMISDLAAQLATAQHQRRVALARAFQRGGRLLPQEVAATADMALAAYEHRVAAARAERETPEASE